MRLTRTAVSAALLAIPAIAAAAGNDDLRALREEVARMREGYEKRIDALEKRLAQAETQAGKAETKAAEASVQAQQAASARPPATANSFNPEIALILNGTYTKQSQDPASYNETPNPRSYHIHGFVPSLGETAPPRKGFGLGESELTISANVDPHWRAQLTAALAPEGGAEVEEAFIQSLGFDNGFTLKAGRFLSGVGYLNPRHAHTWDFADAPLAYKAFFANQLRSDGVQLKWVAPTDLFVELGGEAASGGAFPSTDKNRSGTTLGTLFARVGGDIGISQSWRAGLSALATDPRDRTWNDVDSTDTTVENRFSGKSRMSIADFVWKWAPAGNAKERSLTVQGEYFRRHETGSMTYDANSDSVGTQTGDYSSNQSGGYVQSVYQFQPRWRVGYRYDRLDSGTTRLGLVDSGALTAADFPLLSAHRPTRHTVMMDYATSEFARFRVQFARDKSRFDFGQGRALPDNQIWLQYVVSLGAHGAHKY